MVFSSEQPGFTKVKAIAAVQVARRTDWLCKEMKRLSGESFHENPPIAQANRAVAQKHIIKYGEFP